MSKHSSLEKLSEVKTMLNELQGEWSDTLENLTNAKDEIKTRDLFATLNYLTLCDQICKSTYFEIKDLNLQLKNLEDLRKDPHQSKNSLELIDDLIFNMQEFKEKKEKKIQSLSEEYLVLAEETLRKTQDRVTSFSEAMETENITPNLKTQINQNLEKGLYLQELKDSLETYREAREDYVSAMVGETHLPEDQVPEDLGEEEPEIDFVLSELDTAITACDAALLNEEIGG
jgi:hypothetical protein